MADGPSDAAAAASGSSEQQLESLFEMKKRRAAELKAVREQEQATLKKDQKAGSKERLAYLMKQADIFQHFMSGERAATKEAGGGGSDEPPAASKQQSRRGKGRMSEKAEDELMMKKDDKEADSTRLTSQPACIPAKTGQMRPYQLEGLNWLIRLYENGINGILADEMGLGKTLQTISLLGYLKESRGVAGPHLIITPKSTLTNWGNECARWCPSLKVIRYHGDPKTRLKIKEQYFDVKGEFDVCLTTYESAIAEKASIGKLVWRYLIIDEAHRIKNEQSVLSKVVRLFTTHFRLLITGTPLQNDLHELWAMLNFLLPDIFSSSEDFDSYFNLETKQGAEDVLTQLHKILRPFLLRRLKADVEKDLPPKREIKLLIGLSEMQRRWYSNILEKNIDVLNAMGANRTRMLNMLMQLRKCANHPYLFEGAETPPFTNDERLVKHSGKMCLLDKLLQKLYKGGHRVLIFSQMTRMLDILEDYCQWKDWYYCRIDGGTSGESRDEQMEAFNAKGSKYFLFMLSTRAGGLGINLATADTVILFDSDWNPQADLQAMDRAHRIGQTKPVAVYRFITEGTVEEKIVERAQRKLYLDAAVIQQGRLAEQSKALSKDEILSMVRFGADAVFSAAGADPTEEDLDALLARGEEKTKEDNDRMQQQSNSLANFSLGGEEKSLYEFEGKDMKAGGKDKQWALSLPKRVTKQVGYDESNLFRSGINQGDKGAPRPPKQLPCQDFQFFDTRRLEELREIEMRNFERRKAIYDRRYAPDEEKEELEKTLESAPGLTDEEMEEKEKLLTEGFTQWTRKDLMNFVRGLEDAGRSNLNEVATYVEGKTTKEVAQYAKSFFERYDEIKEWEKLMRRIEAGEAKPRRLALDAALARKIGNTHEPWNTLMSDYTCLGATARPRSPFTIENDRHLLCMALQVGYGRWEELVKEVRKSWLCKFDWHMKTRVASELGKRVEYLMRLVEKEMEDLEAARKEEERKNKKKGGAGAKRKDEDGEQGGDAKRRR